MTCHVIRNFPFLWISLCIMGFVDTSMGADHSGGDPDSDVTFFGTEMSKESGDEVFGIIDPSVEPCDDFWTHACGKWKDRHPKFLSQQERVIRVQQLRLRSLHREMNETNEANKSGMRLKLSNIWRSCIKFVEISHDNAAWKSLENIVRKNGGWPMTFPQKKWPMGDRKLTLQRIHENYGEIADHGALFDVSVDLSQSSMGVKKYVIWLRVPEPRLTETRSRISTASVVAVASEFAKRLRESDISRRLRKSNISVAQIKNEVKEMMRFEKSLSVLKSRTTQKLSIRKLQKAWDKVVSGRPEYAINWVKTIRRVFVKTDIVIDVNNDIVVVPMDMVDKLGNLLKKNSLRTVVNYVHWNAIAVLAPYADKKMSVLINGPQDKNLRIFRCLSKINMVDGLNYLYAKTFFKNFDRARPIIDNMISTIKTSMMKNVKRSTWIEPLIKKRFMNKIHDVISNIGYPNWYDEPGKIDEFYNELDIGSNYFENQMNYNKFRKIKSLKKLHEPYDRNNSAGVDPMATSPRYIPDHNAIDLPLEYFQLPYYHVKGPRVLSYGSIGSLIGHEIGHAIDNEGQRYNRFNVFDELSLSYSIKFDEKVKCLVDQYNRYTYVERSTNKLVNVNGTTTLRENLCDHMGARSALDAYISEMIKTDPHIFDVSTIRKNILKLFFHSLASGWCSSEPSFGGCPKYASHLARVNGIISNMREFSEAFDCPIGKPMNPEKKCSIWQ